MKAGAADFLTKPFHEQELLDAVHHAIGRDREARKKHQELLRRRRQYESLSTRERQVLATVVAGLLNKQIAAELSLAESTVKLHRAEVMQKMDARSLAELVSICSELDTRSSSTGFGLKDKVLSDEGLAPVHTCTRYTHSSRFTCSFSVAPSGLRRSRGNSVALDAEVENGP